MLTPSLSRKSSRPKTDIEALLVRMRNRLYPETIPVLASYWLKTVYAAGHDRAWWRELNRLLKRILSEQILDVPSREGLVDIQNWVQQTGLQSGKALTPISSRIEPLRVDPRPDRLGAYLRRLLNEWLSAEVARALVDGMEAGIPQESGIPALAVGASLERLLLRERLSPSTLEMLLDAKLYSPLYLYPADAEILRDVLLALLGRTWAPALPVMPATLLGAADDFPLPPGYRDAVGQASLMETEAGDQIHVPISPEQASEILHHDPVRISSIIVTMDGRWWESESLQSGERHTVIYTPRGRLRIDDSADHVKLVVPWPGTQLSWPGAIRFQDNLRLFGREWHKASWEMDGERAWLHLVFSRLLPISETQPESRGFRRSHPAAVDMAWAALEHALEASLSGRDCEPILQLRRTDFIPLGRALFELTKVAKGRLANREAVMTHLRAIRYLQASVAEEYGRVPWRILPLITQSAFLRRHLDQGSLELLNEVFDGLPAALTETSHAA